MCNGVMMEETVSWGGVTARWGCKQWGALNLSSHYKYKSPKQFELEQSRKALRALNARWTPPVCPIFENEKSSRQTKNRSREKSHKKDRQD